MYNPTSNGLNHKINNVTIAPVIAVYTIIWSSLLITNKVNPSAAFNPMRGIIIDKDFNMLIDTCCASP